MPGPAQQSGPSGFLPVRKPSGMTSFDVIRRLRGILGVRKLGHSGVLDRPASGVLVVGLNRATRLFELFADFEKDYEADIWLGLYTATDDLTGELIEAPGAAGVDAAAVAAALTRFSGTFPQLPPAFSLAKKAGRELYRYALAGESVEVEPRDVTVLDSALLSFEADVDPAVALSGEDTGAAEGRLAEDRALLPPLALARVRLSCRGGLYVRALARDIGASLGCGGCMGHLVRTRVGPFRLGECRSLDELETLRGTGASVAELLEPLSAVAPETARLQLDATQLGMVRSGRSIRRFAAHLPPDADRGRSVYGVDPAGELAAVLTVIGTNSQGLVELKPTKVIG